MILGGGDCWYRGAGGCGGGGGGGLHRSGRGVREIEPDYGLHDICHDDFVYSLSVRPWASMKDLKQGGSRHPRCFLRKAKYTTPPHVFCAY